MSWVALPSGFLLGFLSVVPEYVPHVPERNRYIWLKYRPQVLHRWHHILASKLIVAQIACKSCIFWQLGGILKWSSGGPDSGVLS